MEEEDDDFYGGPAPAAQHGDFGQFDDDMEPKMEMNEDQDEEEEEEDSDDDVQFTLEKPEGDKPESNSQSQRATKQQSSPADPIKAPRSTTPSIKPERTESAQPTTVKTTLTHNGKDGSSFPAIQRSTLDVNATPTWINGKSITAVDIDADLAEHSKPWRLPGTDQTDFFNYGFDEYTWAQYCLKQQTMVEGIKEQKAADAQMKAMFGGGNPNGGGQGMPGGMPPMPGMPGMPSPEEMMQQMMQQGLNPSDPNAFMQMMMGGGMPGGPGGGGPPLGPSSQQNQQQGGFGGGGGFGGSGQNSASPHPQGQQGFQPPSGPAAQQNQQDPGGFGGNMEGYSPQQLAIMQQQGGGMQGGGGRRGGRGRGRFY